MNRRREWTAVLGIGAGLVWALGCGGGGGGGSGGSAQISGSLSRSGAVQVARLDPSPSWTDWAMGLVGVSTAIAEGTTACGNPAGPASGVTVDLVLNGQVVQSTVTDAEGHFRFTGLQPGDYVIQVTLPSGTISAPAIVQQGQTTTLAGEFDHDCNDVDDDGDHAEISLRVRETSDDGSHLEGEHTEDGGSFDGEVHGEDGSVRHEQGSQGDRSDEQEHDSTDDHGTDSTSTDGQQQSSDDGTEDGPNHN